METTPPSVPPMQKVDTRALARIALYAAVCAVVVVTAWFLIGQKGTSHPVFSMVENGETSWFMLKGSHVKKVSAPEDHSEVFRGMLQDGDFSPVHAKNGTILALSEEGLVAIGPISKTRTTLIERKDLEHGSSAIGYRATGAALFNAETNEIDIFSLDEEQAFVLSYEGSFPAPGELYGVGVLPHGGVVMRTGEASFEIYEPVDGKVEKLKDAKLGSKTGTVLAGLFLPKVAHAWTYGNPLSGVNATTVSGKRCTGAEVASLGVASGSGVMPSVQTTVWNYMGPQSNLPGDYNSPGSYCVQAYVTATPPSGAEEGEGGRGGGGEQVFNKTLIQSALSFFTSSARAQSGSWSVTYSIHSGSGTTNASNYYALNYTGPAGPTVSLSASPSALYAGGAAALTWSSTNATSCTGTGFSTGDRSSGTVSVSPTTTTTYSISCSGSSGSTNDSVDVVVLPAQCADGSDNDGDGLSDMADPGCTSPTDISESNVSSAFSVRGDCGEIQVPVSMNCMAGEPVFDDCAAGERAFYQPSATTRSCSPMNGYSHSDTWGICSPDASCSAPSCNPGGTVVGQMPEGTYNLTIEVDYDNSYNCCSGEVVYGGEYGRNITCYPPGGDDDPVGNSVTAELSASQTSIALGLSTILSWVSTGAQYCTSGTWPDDSTVSTDNFVTGNATGGTDEVTPISVSTDYGLFCYGATGGGTGGGNTGEWVEIAYNANKCFDTCGPSFDAQLVNGSCAPIGETCTYCQDGTGSFNTSIHQCQAVPGGSCINEIEYNPTCNTTHELVTKTCPEGFRVEISEIYDCPLAPNNNPLGFRQRASCVPDASCGGGGAAGFASDIVTVTTTSTCTPEYQTEEWYTGGVQVGSAFEMRNSATDCTTIFPGPGTYTHWNRTVRDVNYGPGLEEYDPIRTTCTYYTGVTGSVVKTNSGGISYDSGSECSGGTTECSDGVDNDGDGSVDYDGAGVWSYDGVESQSTKVCSADVNIQQPACGSASDAPETSCSVGQTCLTHAHDYPGGCSHPGGPPPTGPTLYNTVHKYECAASTPDPGCTGPTDPTEEDEEDPPQCSDGVSNDTDGLVDCADPGCWSVPGNPGTCNPNDPGEDPDTSSGPTVSLEATPSSILAGASALITWDSQNATSCTGTGFSTGGQTDNTSGVSTGPLFANANYQIVCTGPGGQGDDAATVLVVDPEAEISANPDRVAPGNASAITWTTERCTDVSITRNGAPFSTAPSGTNVSSGAITGQTEFVIVCDGGAARDSVIVNVLPTFEEF